jgi:uncharacterized protein YukJ
MIHYVAQVIKGFDGHEYEIRYYKVTENTNKFILYNKNLYFSIPSTDILRKLPVTLLEGSSKHKEATDLFSSGFLYIQCKI